jgi:hypothetical protein
MIEDSTNKYIRENLNNIMNGEFDNEFIPEELDHFRKMSFLLNHITYIENKIVFEYNNLKISCDYKDTQNFIGIDTEFYLTSKIKNTDDFIVSYKSFLRDWKITKILQ